MTPRKTPLLDQLAEHGQAISQANQRARAAQLERDQAVALAEALTAARIDALAAGDEDLAARLEGERDEAQRTAAGLGDRVTAAGVAAKRAEAARRAFAERELSGLLREHARDATAAAAAVESALGELQAAVERYRATAGTTAHLLRLGGRPGERTAELPAEVSDLVRRLSRASASIEAPLPRQVVAA